MYVEDNAATVLDPAQTGLAVAFLHQYFPMPMPASFIVPIRFGPEWLTLSPYERIQQVQLVGLLPSQQIVAHQDQPIVGLRYHLVLQTNPGCWSFSGGVWQQLELGHFYRMDPAEEHGAVNWGSELRLHLMIDVEAANVEDR